MSKELRVSLLITTIIFVVSFIALFQFRRSSPCKIGRVLDADENPIANAYVIYGYHGINYVHGEVDRPGTIIQSDKGGYFRIPSKVHRCLPLFSSKLYPKIYTVYDTKTHCAGTVPFRRLNSAQLRYFEEGHWWFERKKINGIDTLVFHDVTNDPLEWYSSIRQLQEAFSYYGVLNGWAAPAEKKAELLNCVIKEYEDFKTAYGNEWCTLTIAKDLNVKTFNEVIGYEIGLLRVPLEDEVRQKYVDRIERLREEWRKSVKESGLYRQ